MPAATCSMSVDNSVDNLWITSRVIHNYKYFKNFIHRLSTGYPQSYPQVNLLFLNKKSELSTENGFPYNNNI